MAKKNKRQKQQWIKTMQMTIAAATTTTKMTKENQVFISLSLVGLGFVWFETKWKILVLAKFVVSVRARLSKRPCSWTCVNMAENGRFLAPIELELTRRQNEHQILAWMGTLTMACGIFPWKLFLCENNSLVGSICPPQQSSCHPLSLGTQTQAVHRKEMI